jgi:hypothetical protein
MHIDYCVLYNCPVDEANCERKQEYGCAGCTEFREVPKMIFENSLRRW